MRAGSVAAASDSRGSQTARWVIVGCRIEERHMQKGKRASGRAAATLAGQDWPSLVGADCSAAAGGVAVGSQNFGIVYSQSWLEFLAGMGFREVVGMEARG